MASDVQLVMKRGDSALWDFVATYPSGAPLVLTSATVWMTAKNQLSDADVAAVFQVSTTGGQITLTDAPNGKFRVQLTPSNTNTLTKDTNLFWDVQVKDASGKIYTVADGTLLVKLDATITTA